MTDGDQPIRARTFDLQGLTDVEFEALCSRLARIEDELATATDNPDGGADSLLPGPTGGWVRAWQAKHSKTGHISWAKCEESLDAAVENYGIPRMTFCFPRNLTVKQQKIFDSRLVSRLPGVRVDHWGADEITARMTESAAGEAVARHFFGDPAEDAKSITRTIRAGGPLKTGADAIERARPIGEFLKGHDPYFSYPKIVVEPGLESAYAPPPGTLATLLSNEDGTTVRIDAVPKDDEARRRFTPKFSLSFSDSPEGKKAESTIQEAIRDGGPVTVHEGVRLSIDQLPPLFSQFANSDDVDALTIRSELPPWRIVLSISTPGGDNEFPMELQPLEEAPEGWHHSFRGSGGGMSVGMLMRREGEFVTILMDTKFTSQGSSAKQRLPSFRLAAAHEGAGSISIQSIDQDWPPITVDPHPTVLGESLTLTLWLFESLAIIEDWIQSPISPTGEGETQLSDVFLAADLVDCINQGFTTTNFVEGTIWVPDDAVKPVLAGAVLPVRKPFIVSLFGRELHFAQEETVVRKANVSLPPNQECPAGMTEIQFSASSGDGEPFRWTLSPPGPPMAG
jgi:hypothetical protein